MKASELIASLQAAIAEHGDLPVGVCFEAYDIACEPVVLANEGHMYLPSGGSYSGPYLCVSGA